MTSKGEIHLAGLSGLRAIAALGVVVAHIRLAQPEFGLPLAGYYQFGTYAVTIFFALSGFLITYLLLAEREQQLISVTNFYMRRILRIWPLYFAYLAIALAIAAIALPSALPGTLFFYLALLANVPRLLGQPLPLLDHYWSLAAEEQFYLVWPWILRWIRRPVRDLGLVLLLLLLARPACRVFFGDTSRANAFWYVSYFDCMLIGALGGAMYQTRYRLLLIGACNPFTQVSAWLFLGLLIRGWPPYRIPLLSYGLSHDLVALVVVLVVVAQAERRWRIVALDWRPLESLGRVSYGIYVLHPLVIWGLARFIAQLDLPLGLRVLLSYSAVIGLTVLLAVLSYTLLESRFLRWKRRFQVVGSRG